MKKVLIAAALAAAPIATPVTASPGEARRDVPIQIVDLDLGTREGLATLDRRLAQAVVKACGSAHYLEPEELDARDRCRAAARVRAMAVREAILARSKSGTAPVAGASR